VIGLSFAKNRAIIGGALAHEVARAGGSYMPTYEYVCNKCGKKFSLLLSISEHDKKKARCPKCKSIKVEQLLLSFFAVTSKKS
jgi:putative FmdB family regulatory protein